MHTTTSRRQSTSTWTTTLGTHSKASALPSTTHAGRSRRLATLTSSDLTWPGVDRDRAVAAAWHLERAAFWLGVLRNPLETGPRWRAIRAAGEHLRIGYGFLGSIGFEHGYSYNQPKGGK